MLMIRHHGRLLASTGLAAALALPNILGVPPQPAEPLSASGPAILMQQSAGKVADRMPGPGPEAPLIAAAPAPTAWPMVATMQAGYAFDLAAQGPTAASASTAVLTERPAHSAAKAQRTKRVLARLPPARPATLEASSRVLATVRPARARPSIGTRMVAFVDSLTALGSLL